MAVQAVVLSGTLQAALSPAFTDFTSSGFGTPDAAIVYCSDANLSANPQAYGQTSIGFFDGTTQVAQAIGLDDAAGTTNTGSHSETDNIVLCPFGTTGSEYKASWVSDGLRITHTVDLTGIARYATVILIKGLKNAYVGTHQMPASGTATQNITTPGFKADMVFLTSIGSSSQDAFVSDAILSFGAASIKTAVSQACIGWSSKDAEAAASIVTQVTRNDSAVTKVFNDANSWNIAVAENANGFNLTADAATSSEYVHYLALSLPHEDDGYVGIIDSATGTGNQAYTGTGFTPEVYSIIAQLQTAVNTLDTAPTGSHTLFATDGTTTQSLMTGDEDAVGTSNNYSRRTTNFNLRFDNDSDDAVATVTSLDTDGITLNYSDGSASARKMFAWALGDSGSAVEQDTGFFYVRRKFTSQPQGTADVAWSNPAATNLKILTCGSGSSLHDIANRTLITVNGSPAVGPEFGEVVTKLDGTNDYLSIPSLTSLASHTGPISLLFRVRAATDSVKVLFNLANGDSLTDFFTIFLGDGATSTITNEVITVARQASSVATTTLAVTSADRTVLYDGATHTILLTSDGSDWKIALDGVDQTLDLGTIGLNDGLISASGATSLYVGRRSYSPSPLYLDGSISVFGLWYADVSRYAKVLHENVWELFEAPRLAFFSIVTGGDIVLTVNDLSQAQTLDKPAISGALVLAPNDLSQAQTLDKPTIAAAITLTPNDLLQAQTLDKPTVFGGLVLAPNDLSQAQTLDKPTIFGALVLAVNDLLQAQTLDKPNVTVEETTLAINDLLQAQTLDKPTVFGALGLSVNDLSQAQTLDKPTIAASILLAINDLLQAQTVEKPTITAVTASAVWDTLIADGYTAAEILRLMAAVLLGKVSGGKTGTETFRSIGDTKDAVISENDSDGNRTNVTLDKDP